MPSASCGFEATVVTALDDGVAAALQLSVTNGATTKQYLFNVPEGYSRLALEHKVRHGLNFQAAFVTNLEPPAQGGMGGLILRLRADGLGKAQLIGPTGLRKELEGLHMWMPWRYPEVHVHEVGPDTQGSVFSDELVEVVPLIPGAKSWQPPTWTCAEGKTAPAASSSNQAHGSKRKRHGIKGERLGTKGGSRGTKGGSRGRKGERHGTKGERRDTKRENAAAGESSGSSSDEVGNIESSSNNSSSESENSSSTSGSSSEGVGNSNADSSSSSSSDEEGAGVGGEAGGIESIGKYGSRASSFKSDDSSTSADDSSSGGSVEPSICGRKVVVEIENAIQPSKSSCSEKESKRQELKNEPGSPDNEPSASESQSNSEEESSSDELEPSSDAAELSSPMKKIASKQGSSSADEESSSAEGESSRAEEQCSSAEEDACSAENKTSTSKKKTTLEKAPSTKNSTLKTVCRSPTDKSNSSQEEPSSPAVDSSSSEAESSSPADDSNSSEEESSVSEEESSSFKTIKGPNLSDAHGLPVQEATFSALDQLFSQTASRAAIRGGALQLFKQKQHTVGAFTACNAASAAAEGNPAQAAPEKRLQQIGSRMQQNSSRMVAQGRSVWSSVGPDTTNRPEAPQNGLPRKKLKSDASMAEKTPPLVHAEAPGSNIVSPAEPALVTGHVKPPANAECARGPAVSYEHAGASAQSIGHAKVPSKGNAKVPSKGNAKVPSKGNAKVPANSTAQMPASYTTNMPANDIKSSSVAGSERDYVFAALDKVLSRTAHPSTTKRSVLELLRQGTSTSKIGASRVPGRTSIAGLKCKGNAGLKFRGKTDWTREGNTDWTPNGNTDGTLKDNTDWKPKGYTDLKLTGYLDVEPLDNIKSKGKGHTELKPTGINMKPKGTTDLKIKGRTDFNAKGNTTVTALQKEETPDKVGQKKPTPDIVTQQGTTCNAARQSELLLRMEAQGTAPEIENMQGAAALRTARTSQALQDQAVHGSTPAHFHHVQSSVMKMLTTRSLPLPIKVPISKCWPPQMQSQPQEPVAVPIEAPIIFCPSNHAPGPVSALPSDLSPIQPGTAVLGYLCYVKPAQQLLLVVDCINAAMLTQLQAHPLILALVPSVQHRRCVASGQRQHDVAPGLNQHNVTSGQHQHDVASGQHQHDVKLGRHQHGASPAQHPPSLVSGRCQHDVAGLAEVQTAKQTSAWHKVVTVMHLTRPAVCCTPEYREWMYHLPGQQVLLCPPSVQESDKGSMEPPRSANGMNTGQDGMDMVVHRSEKGVNNRQYGFYLVDHTSEKEMNSGRDEVDMVVHRCDKGVCSHENGGHNGMDGARALSKNWVNLLGQDEKARNAGKLGLHESVNAVDLMNDDADIRTCKDDAMVVMNDDKDMRMRKVNIDSTSKYDATVSDSDIIMDNDDMARNFGMNKDKIAMNMDASGVRGISCRAGLLAAAVKVTMKLNGVCPAFFPLPAWAPSAERLAAGTRMGSARAQAAAANVAAQGATANDGTAAGGATVPGIVRGHMVVQKPGTGSAAGMATEDVTVQTGLATGDATVHVQGIVAGGAAVREGLVAGNAGIVAKGLVTPALAADGIVAAMKQVAGTQETVAEDAALVAGNREAAEVTTLASTGKVVLGNLVAAGKGGSRCQMQHDNKTTQAEQGKALEGGQPGKQCVVHWEAGGKILHARLLMKLRGSCCTDGTPSLLADFSCCPDVATPHAVQQALWEERDDLLDAMQVLPDAMRRLWSVHGCQETSKGNPVDHPTSLPAQWHLPSENTADRDLLRPSHNTKGPREAVHVLPHVQPHALPHVPPHAPPHALPHVPPHPPPNVPPHVMPRAPPHVPFHAPSLWSANKRAKVQAAAGAPWVQRQGEMGYAGRVGEVAWQDGRHQGANSWCHRQDERGAQSRHGAWQHASSQQEAAGKLPGRQEATTRITSPREASGKPADTQGQITEKPASPGSPHCLDPEKCQPPLHAQLLSDLSQLEEEPIPACLLGPAAQGSCLMFLGTGSAEPSKYRGPSAILLHMPGDKAILMDVGEGTTGQLVRLLGPTAALHLLCHLHCVWISHRHADHLLGLPGILAARPASVPPLLIVGPQSAQDWLKHVAPNHGWRCRFMSCRAFQDGQHSGQQQEVMHSLGMHSWHSIPVQHCSDAWGLYLQHREGWSLLYSGDTRPCARVAALARGVTVLIHEATFEPGLAGMAVSKRHSTSEEALQLGWGAGAYRTLLTHFSQRYAKVPDGIDVRLSPVGRRAAIAFDGMCLPLALLPHVPLVTPLVARTLEDIEDTDAAGEAAEPAEESEGVPACCDEHDTPGAIDVL